MINWELCKKFKFDHTIKWYIHKLESVQENETHKIFWDYEIQTDYLIRARRPDRVIIKTIFRSHPRTKKIAEHEGDDDTNCNRLGNVIKGLERLSKAWKVDWKCWNSDDESGPSRIQHCWDRPEYWEESRRHVETCSHSDSSERPSANADVKNSERV